MYIIFGPLSFQQYIIMVLPMVIFSLLILFLVYMLLVHIRNNAKKKTKAAEEDDQARQKAVVDEAGIKAQMDTISGSANPGHPFLTAVFTVCNKSSLTLRLSFTLFSPDGTEHSALSVNPDTVSPDTQVEVCAKFRTADRNGTIVLTANDYVFSFNFNI